MSATFPFPPLPLALPPPPIAIGDLQGCCDALHRLLERLPSPDAPLWFTGDLVNRGPRSLDTLRTVIALGDRATAVLGNHDLHLLAVAAGIHPLKKGDTLDQILSAPDAANLIDWLRHRPLAHFGQGMLLVHAGVLPQWDVAQTMELAHEVEQRLRGPRWQEAIATLYDSDSSSHRLRTALDALTRMRFCTADGKMNFTAKGNPASAPPGYLPWFEVPGRRTAEVTIVFGHWAALGLMMRDKLIALDSGCVWGNQLSAVTLDPNPARRALTQVDCSRDG